MRPRLNLSDEAVTLDGVAGPRGWWAHPTGNAYGEHVLRYARSWPPWEAVVLELEGGGELVVTQTVLNRVASAPPQ